MTGLPGLPRPFKIAAVRQENARTRSLVLDGALQAAPGQFVMAWLPRFDEKPFSLVDGDPVTLMVTAVGPFSQLLHERKPGDRLWLRGPFGRGFVVGEGQRRLALVGGGYGVAPLHWLARSQDGRAERITTIIGARTGRDLLYADRFRALSAGAARQALLLTTEDGSEGMCGRVTEALAPLLDAGAVDAIFACGPHGMLSALAQLGGRHHIPCQLSWEAYMRCAIGICGACEHDGKVLCLDGPVLSTAV